ncbi:hypothetical protein [Acinetobacter sp. YH01020]|uniref:hypothetical protein n=1 Tax=Acinetobacter sp. YH01020 TaxID=2601034 RepID=UPI0015D2EFEA|nr:hypothetical protein [Acinetobacter sp. YH01020]
MNTAQVIPFKKPSPPEQEAGNMYSDKFVQGYVMSSRLYRKEVWPFLSDAARNVYAELENRINGHNKESDFVSYSQLQGGELKGSRKLSRETVRNGIDELLKLKVVSIAGTGSRGVKKYVLNEISLKYQFTSKTSSTTELVRKVNHTSSTTEPVTSSETEHTIDTPIESLENNNKAPEQFSPQNRPMLQFIEYRLDDQQAYTLRELTQKYPAQSDFTAQAKISFPKLTDEQINGELRNLAQWSMTAEKRISQKWMTTWLNWLKNFENAQNKTQQKSNQPKAQKQQPKKAHRFGQGVINP